MLAGPKYQLMQVFSVVILNSEHWVVIGISEVLVMETLSLKRLSGHLTRSSIMDRYQLNGKIAEWTGNSEQKRHVNLYARLISLLQILHSTQLLKKNEPLINLISTLTLTLTLTSKWRLLKKLNYLIQVVLH